MVLFFSNKLAINNHPLSLKINREKHRVFNLPLCYVQNDVAAFDLLDVLILFFKSMEFRVIIHISN